jgi:N-acyl-D-amino-acid deacylase
MREDTFTIKGVDVINGNDTPAKRQDVLVTNGVIAEVGSILKGNELGKVIDGSGLTLTPGFIDMHAHSDLAVLADPQHLAKVSQGVTLEVVGQDGLSYVPCNPESQLALREQLYGWNSDPKDFDWNFYTVEDYLKKVDDGCAVNVAYLLPHGSIRLMVRGSEPGLASVNELAQMKQLIMQGMQQGAFGLSAGLTYTPAMYADDNEIIELCKVVSDFGGFYAPHHRNYGARFLDAVNECLAIAKLSNTPLHLTHCHMSHPNFHGKTGLLFEQIEEAEQNGVEVTLDTYPYLAGSTYLHALLPSWVQAGGSVKTIQRLKTREQRQQVIYELTVAGSDGNHGGIVNWPAITIAGVEKSANLRFVGLDLVSAANLVSKKVEEFYLDFIIDEELKASCVIFAGHEPNVRAIMQDKRHMVGSDGILTGNRPHPRGYGTFARYLGVYAREEKVLSLPGAICRMTSRPAKRLGLTDRGYVKTGMKADLVLFDADAVIDRATYESPRVAAAGFEMVWVAGIATLRNGQRTQATPGVGLRKRS